ncbi:AEC family transporter [Paenibacillus sp. HJGM_3]|uniref:AEC family transporter n=1 Tax=Paenibacillus sp. HJGM_3 TaxID=3379816 RepID=UPI00385E121B
MSYFSYILLNNVVPLSLMIAAGVVLQLVFKLDIRTLSKLNFFLFSPCIMFLMLYESAITLNIMLQVLLFICAFFAASYILIGVVMKLRGYSGSMKSAMRNSVLFYNSANYAIPLNQLVFVNDPFTLSIQIIIMMMQSLLPNTYGIYSVNSHRQSMRETLRTILTMPTIYVIPIALTMRWLHIPLPHPIYISIDYVGKGFIATALITLGVQLGGMKWRLQLSDVMLSNVMRLCVGPLLGFVLVWALGIEGDMAKALVLSCAVPTSLSSVLLAVEFDSEPEFASQAVFSSTVFSIFTVTFVIYLLQYVG